MMNTSILQDSKVNNITDLWKDAGGMKTGLALLTHECLPHYVLAATIVSVMRGFQLYHLSCVSSSWSGDNYARTGITQLD